VLIALGPTGQPRAYEIWELTPAALPCRREAVEVSVITKSEVVRVEKLEGRMRGSERQVGQPFVAQDAVGDGAITSEFAT
jgi:hypothetical protein